MRPAYFTTCFLALATVLGPSAASAALITVPIDLTPGDSYRLIFVSSTRRNATDLSISAYNTHVGNAVSNNSPTLNALGATWNAIVSTSSVNAITNTTTDPSPVGPTGEPIYLVTGGRVADHYDDLWDGSLLLKIDSDETGAMGISDRVWTGTGTGGTAASPLGGGGSGKIGNTAFTNLQWVNNATQNKSNAERFYGISDVLTVPTVSIPEPRSAILLCGLAFVMSFVCCQRLLRK
ncbi:MAG: PEP-CTERM sorting domain-containing protein [Planctomycetota bacterium]|nr:PEP-CTERM sorting domain-containing protein [Planctomycetota bacterium]